VSSDFAAFALHRPFCDSICNTLHKIGKIRGPSQGLTVEEIVHILVRATETAKHDTKIQGDRKALQQHLEKLATLAIAVMEK
jgi:hypothetical protein